MSIVRSRIVRMLSGAIAPLIDHAHTSSAGSVQVELEIPKIPEHGDFATNVALTLTRILKRNPREIAAHVVEGLKDESGLLERVEIAGPGFINLFVKPAAWHDILR